MQNPVNHAHCCQYPFDGERGHIRFICRFAFRQRKSIFLLQIFSLVWTLEQVAWPAVLGMIISAMDGFADGDRTSVWLVLKWPLLCAGTLWIGVDIMFRVMHFIKARYFLPHIRYCVRREVMDYIMRKSVSFFLDNQSGSIVNRVDRLTEAVGSIICDIVQVIVPAFCTVLFVSISVYCINVTLGFIILLLIFLHIIIIAIYLPKIVRVTEMHAKVRSNLTGSTIDIVRNILSVKMFSGHCNEMKILGIKQDRERATHELALMYPEQMKIILAIVGFLVAGVLFTYTEYALYIDHKLDLAHISYNFMAIANMMFAMWHSSEDLVPLFQNIGIVKDSITQLFNSKYRLEDVKSSKNEGVIVFSSGKIEFRNVSFGYGGNSLFVNKNIVIKSKEKVGLVGSSGSGKTTFVNLILGNFSLDVGQIIIDGHDIATLSHDDVRRNIATVMQDCSLFNRSVIENIHYGLSNISNDKVIEAAKKANAHDFIMDMQYGYATMISEGGSKLSGGQRQRIAIARAILKDSPILILDEFTSALDSETEMMIQSALNELTKNRTVITIAHRLNILKKMDRILFFDGGEIVEDGSHEELIKNSNGHYYKMWSLNDNASLSSLK